MKRIIATILSIVLCLSCASTAFALDSKSGKLSFDENGKFKMLLLADTQDGYPLKESLKAYISEALDKTQPDLVVFLGDNIVSSDDHSEERYWKAYDELLEPIVSRGVPFTLVFGNHDDESMEGVSKEQMLKKYQSYPGCLAYDADPSLHGCATHNVEILSSDRTHTAYNLWLMDSGDYCYCNGKKHYDCVRKDQLKWYNEVSKQLEAENGAPVHSMMFQHIVPIEVAENVMFTLPTPIEKITKIVAHDGTSVTYLPNYKDIVSGYVMEAPCPSRDSEGQWDIIRQRGDVDAVFFGHDHTNTFRADVNGVDAVNVPGATYRSYFSYTEQGSLLVTIDEATGNYEMEHIYSTDLALEDGSALPGLDRSIHEYRFAKLLRGMLNCIVTLFKNVVKVFDIIKIK